MMVSLQRIRGSKITSFVILFMVLFSIAGSTKSSIVAMGNGVPLLSPANQVSIPMPMAPLTAPLPVGVPVASNMGAMPASVPLMQNYQVIPFDITVHLAGDLLPEPTSTPDPTPIPTAEPTSTPSPTPTPTPIPTSTPVPTPDLTPVLPSAEGGQGDNGQSSESGNGWSNSSDSENDNESVDNHIYDVAAQCESYRTALYDNPEVTKLREILSTIENAANHQFHLNRSVAFGNECSNGSGFNPEFGIYAGGDGDLFASLNGAGASADARLDVCFYGRKEIFKYDFNYQKGFDIPLMDGVMSVKDQISMNLDNYVDNIKNAIPAGICGQLDVDNIMQRFKEGLEADVASANAELQELNGYLDSAQNEAQEIKNMTLETINDAESSFAFVSNSGFETMDYRDQDAIVLFKPDDVPGPSFSVPIAGGLLNLNGGIGFSAYLGLQWAMGFEASGASANIGPILEGGIYGEASVSTVGNAAGVGLRATAATQNKVDFRITAAPIYEPEGNRIGIDVSPEIVRYTDAVGRLDAIWWVKLCGDLSDYTAMQSDHLVPFEESYRNALDIYWEHKNRQYGGLAAIVAEKQIRTEIKLLTLAYLSKTLLEYGEANGNQLMYEVGQQLAKSVVDQIENTPGLDMAFFKSLQNAWKSLQRAADQVRDSVTNAVNNLSSNLSQEITNTINTLIDTIDLLATPIEDLISIVGNELVNVVESVVDATETVLEFAEGIVGQMLGMFCSMLERSGTERLFETKFGGNEQVIWSQDLPPRYLN